MIGFLMQALVWLVILLAMLFLVLHGGMRLAAWIGPGITLTRNGKRYQVKLRHWLPRLINRLRSRFGKTPIYAITIGRIICVAGDECWPQLHAHEWKHVDQDDRYERFGGLENELYYDRALFLGHGYGVDHWAEAEAIAFATQYSSEFKHLRLVAAPRAPLAAA